MLGDSCLLLGTYRKEVTQNRDGDVTDDVTWPDDVIVRNSSWGFARKRLRIRQAVCIYSIGTYTVAVTSCQ